jgi:hypothetical protein
MAKMPGGYKEIRDQRVLAQVGKSVKRSRAKPCPALFDRFLWQGTKQRLGPAVQLLDPFGRCACIKPRLFLTGTCQQTAIGSGDQVQMAFMDD